MSVYSHNRGRFHHLVFAFRGLLWLFGAIFAMGYAHDGWIWLATLLLTVIGAVFWRRLEALEIVNQLFIIVDFVLISLAIHLSGGLQSQAYMLYGGEALFLTAYGTIRYSGMGIGATIVAYGLATGAWDARLFWWRNVAFALYFLGAGGLGEEYRRTRSRSRENYITLNQVSRLRTLQESIVEEQDIDVVLTRLLAEAREMTGALAAYLVRFGPSHRIGTVVTDGFTLPEDLNITASSLPEAFHVLGEDDEAGWADPLHCFLKHAGMRSLALTPLRREDSIYGWMGLAANQPAASLHSQELVIRSLGDMMSTQMKFHESQAVAAKRGKLLGILEHVGRIVNRNLEMEQLLRSLRQAVSDVLEIDSFMVVLTLPDDATHAFMQYLWDDNEEYPPEVISLDPEGLTGGVIASGEPLLLGEGAQGQLTGSQKVPKGMLFVPLIHEGRVLGAMSAQSYRIEYDPDHLEFLSAIGSQAAIAIRNAQMYQQTQEIALTDYLTGLGNSRRFTLVLQGAIEVAAETGQPLSLLLIDSDSLKSINDRFGHRAGDLHLQRLAQLIRESVRDGDLPFRYAGDEFVVILPKTVIGDALQVAERIRHAIELTRIQWIDTPIVGSTVSVGTAEYRLGMTSDELFQSADRAMYRAKQEGKNRVAQA